MGVRYKAIQATAPGKPRAAELTVPEPPPEHVSVRVEACDIRDSDALTIEGGFRGLSLPRVPGQEVGGRIDALGLDVQQWQMDQRVAIGFLGGHCGVWSPWRRGVYWHRGFYNAPGERTSPRCRIMLTVGCSLARSWMTLYAR